ncbi:hypothetical protein [Brevibacterium sediminis]|uniref:hypothetical protein n=1 Tax=Brevibacterium sediminis TaxID=1857024 RepID=UPI003B3BC5B1
MDSTTRTMRVPVGAKTSIRPLAVMLLAGTNWTRPVDPPGLADIDSSGHTTGVPVRPAASSAPSTLACSAGAATPA